MIAQALESFKHCCQIQIRFKDIDKQGHVNNAVHLTYFEIARSHYFKDVLKHRNNWEETGIILASTKIDYKSPIFLDDDLHCYTKISKLGNKSFDITHILLTKKVNAPKQIVAHGLSTMVCFNYNSNQSIPIPQTWGHDIKCFENIS